MAEASEGDDVEVIFDNEERDAFYANMLSSGLKILEETEKMSSNELHMACSELLKLSHQFMQHYVHIHQLLQQSFAEITSNSRKTMTSNTSAAASKVPNFPGASDVVKGAMDSYRAEFKELMEPVPRLRASCLEFSKYLRSEVSKLRRRNSASPTPVQTMSGAARDPSDGDDTCTSSAQGAGNESTFITCQGSSKKKKP